MVAARVEVGVGGVQQVQGEVGRPGGTGQGDVCLAQAAGHRCDIIREGVGGPGERASLGTLCQGHGEAPGITPVLPAGWGWSPDVWSWRRLGGWVSDASGETSAPDSSSLGTPGDKGRHTAHTVFPFYK